MFEQKGDRQEFALDLVRQLMQAPVRRIAIENPVSVINSRIRKPDQIIQPWWFGHEVNKSTCLWLKGLPKLRATAPVTAFGSAIRDISPSPERSKERSKTFAGVALAMAEQWGPLL